MKITDPLMTLIPIELIRVMIDYLGTDFETAYKISQKCFNFELDETLGNDNSFIIQGKELEQVLPRHAQIVNMIDKLVFNLDDQEASIVDFDFKRLGQLWTHS